MSSQAQAKQHRNPALVVGLLVAVVEIFRIGWLLHFPVGKMVQRIPDDAFYYLVLAHNFASQHRWTFDGIAPASGFHLIWGYLLAFIFKLAPSIGFKQIFTLGAAIEACAMGFAAGLTVAALRRLIAPRASWPVAVIFLSAISLMQGTLMMEGPFVLLAGALLLYQLSRASSSGKSLALGLLLGCLGTLARSDFGLLPFWLFLGLLLSRPRDAARSALIRTAAAQLAGAGLGVFILLLHTHWISGHFTQSSAQMKLLWATMEHSQIKELIALQQGLVSPLYNAIGPFENSFWSRHVVDERIRNVLYLLLIVGAVRFFLRHRQERSGALVAAVFGVLACYTVFYRFDGTVQMWYIVSFELSVCVLAVAAWNSLREKSQFRLRPLVIGLCFAGIVFSLRAEYPWQEVMYRGGVLLHENPGLKPAGAWNSGILNYFAGGGVTNLDGLVNDDAVSYIKNGMLADYIAQRQIRSLVDSPDILTGSLALRSGIADGRLASCVVNQQVLFPGDPFDWFHRTHLTLITVDDACLTRRNPKTAVATLNNQLVTR